ncbi:fimbrial protein domain-containing protein [Alcanivorax balearicus MACL04]|uniref:Fimbrial protein domain-containing protein n=1 Tax=Alloalcanivorax balearicus MACL04 TaxID=1177182 RepID=A0ABT2QXZ1_9GAMM|nr:fimbrial protein [Alloalcanivorax balearicus]MCU5782367.1 fimbrial protein domain-containing protein [Alloalcanivorax balearicus MACL04]
MNKVSIPNWFVASIVVLVLSMVSISARAACYVETSVQNINMRMGQVTITPNVPVGTVLAMQEFPIGAREDAVRCYGGGGYMRGRTLIGNPSSYDPNIYTTQVDGIGIRLSRRIAGLSQTVVYPHDLRLNSSRGRLSEGYFRVEIIKIANQTGSGTLAPGQYTTYYADGSGSGTPILTSYLDASAITIVSSACEVDMGSRNIAVDFGTVSRSVFSGVGSTNTEKEFQVGLSCVGPSNGQDTVKLSFGYTPDPSGAAGVIKIDGGTEAASGVGIQLLDNRTSSPIANGERVELGTVTPGDHQFQLPLKARYYQTAPIVNGGETRAIATFTIEYN